MSEPEKNAEGNFLADAKRVVVKIGSALLTGSQGGEIHEDWLAALGEDIRNQREDGKEILVVSSGALAVGRRQLNLADALRLEEKQAAAAVGQNRLAHAYQQALAPHGINVAQILITLEDTEERRRHLNARSTIRQLLDLGILPVVNENDTIATSGIRYGDNDRLAARVAAMISADTLVLLSDVDGLYERDPRGGGDIPHIPIVREITAKIETMGGKAPQGYSSGGMATKIQAGRIALSAGCRMVIMDGRAPRPLERLAGGAKATWFIPSASPQTARKRWIVSAVNPTGAVTVDNGAEKALKQGKSLLPAGVVGASGAFERGDAVIVRNEAGRDIGRGLSAYSADDALCILGHKTSEIEGILGWRGRDELIHRDNFVLTG